MERKLLIVACIALAGLAAVAGVASGETYSGVNGTDMPLNQTFDVSNDTESLNVIAENVTNDTASLTVFGVDDAGNLTEVSTASITTDAANGTYTDSFTYSGLNASKYGSYKLSLAGDGADTVEMYALRRDGGGGAGFLGGGGLGGLPATELAGAGLVILMLGGAWIVRRD
jgi:hypothetical protein